MNAEAQYIRETIEREQYQRALAQWNKYAQHLRGAVEAGGCPTEQMEEARALFEWSRATLLGARAQLRARLHELEVAAAYEPRRGAPEHRPGVLDTRL